MTKYGDMKQITTNISKVDIYYLCFYLLSIFYISIYLSTDMGYIKNSWGYETNHYKYI